MRFSFCCLTVALILGIGPRLPAASDKGDSKPAEVIREILVLVNREREKEKLEPLTMNDQLSTAAQGHSENMAKHGKTVHDLDGKGPLDRIAASGYKHRGWGENVAMTGAPSAEKAVKLWMESPPHRKNILDGKFQEIGIGLARNAKGSTYYTQVFGTPKK